MDTFPCHGWLHITTSGLLPESHILVKVTHKLAHTPYWWRDIPEDVRNLIKQSGDLQSDKVSFDLILISDSLVAN